MVLVPVEHPVLPFAFMQHQVFYQDHHLQNHHRTLLEAQKTNKKNFCIIESLQSEYVQDIKCEFLNKRIP